MDCNPSLRPDIAVDARAIRRPRHLLNLVVRPGLLYTGETISLNSTEVGQKVDLTAWKKESVTHCTENTVREGYYEVAVKNIAGEI